MIRIVSRLRYVLGTTRLAVRKKIGPWPLRLRRPLFRPQREFERILALHPRRPDGTGWGADWESHQPVLVELLRRVPGARVLELGIGYASTPVVLGLSASSVSIETVDSWYRRFARFDTPSHRIIPWRDFTFWEWRACPFLQQEWDVAFVDNAPAGSRQSNLLKLAHRSRFIVCHDTEELYKPSAAEYRWDFSSFRHVWTFTEFPTYTTVVSNVEPIPLADLVGVEGPPPLAPKTG